MNTEDSFVNTLKFVIKFCFQFQLTPLYSINFDDYVTLHNLSMLLTFYHNIPCD